MKPKEEIKPAAKKTPGPSILADQFAGRTESFNEQLGIRKQGDDVLEILRTKPLSSLNEAIGINDKFLFIREIFDGDTESYNEDCLLYTSDAADDPHSVDLGGRRIIKKKINQR